MAIQVQDISLVIPKRLLTDSKKKKKLLLSLQKKDTQHVSHDRFLIRDSAVSIDDAVDMVEFWINAGLSPYKVVDGTKMWNEMCIIDSELGPTLPCDWIDWNPHSRQAKIKRRRRLREVS